MAGAEIREIREPPGLGSTGHQSIMSLMSRAHRRSSAGRLNGFLRRTKELTLGSSRRPESTTERHDRKPEEAGSRYRSEARNDQWIVEHVFPGLRGGYFLEAGAANGKDVSSCYVLEKELGWTGICIEPHTGFFQQLEVNRPGSICLNLCLSDVAGTVTFIEGDDDSLSPYLSGIESNLRRFKDRGEQIARLGRRVEKKAEVLASVLRDCGAPRVIDYAAFDIEGSELAVLREFPFGEYRFRALSLECDARIWDAVTKILLSHGYQEEQNPFNPDMPWERYWLSDAAS